MNFLEPLFLVGLLGAALPLVVHLINRRKATRRAFPALSFLLESDKRTARSLKVRQWLLMALRMLAVALLALAIAKPFVLSDAGVTAGERMPTAVAIVVDTSASMQADGWWEVASDEVDDAMGALRPWDEVGLVTTTQREIPARLTDNHADVRERVDQLSPRPQSGDLKRALQAAQDLLSTSQLPNRRVVLISDLSATSLDQASGFDEGFPYPIEVVDVREDAGQSLPENLSVTNVSYTQDSAEENLWRIEATIKNWSAEAASDVGVELSLAGELLASDRIERIGPREEEVHVFRHRSDTPGVFAGTVSLGDEDAYPLDDVRHFVFRTRAKLETLLVNGEPASIAYDDEMFFLSRALNPKQSSEAGIVPTVVTPEGLVDKELSTYDAIILANVPRVPAAMATKLERYVRDGGGLMIAAGDQLDIEAYNQSLRELLPKPLRGLKKLAERDDPDAPVKITRLGAVNHKHPIFRAFSLPGGATLQSAKVFSYMLLEPSAPEQSTTLLSYKDNAPALLERQIGDGRVLLLTTTVDFEWTDLPIRSAYLPLMQRTIQYLARRTTSAGKAKYVAGERARMDVAGMVQERAILKGPMDADDPERIVVEPEEGQLAFTLSRVGVWGVWAEEDSDDGKRLADLTFAVHPPAEESDLTKLNEEALARWMGNDAEDGEQEGAAGAAPPQDQRRVNLWPTILFLVTLALLFETLIGTRRSVLLKLWRTITRQKVELS